ncbi:chromate resistance protein ChrB domain-containing protein [Pseudorhodoplanes sp.]|uniref:chromate resistance protein ChrB domain-containing protein n=1 Tax=Pseudorhodoplanes sp. TaxID=1934341 RepID=UPI002C674548|nr:chromate resistance protein ChrB domain-containing protein [Pseudorhodoplanes sp.]HWV40094.1 chromate resistance protein ChrB domain-containing protein [Pseudorhodoplanes sp.]
MALHFSITPEQLWRRTGTSDAPLIVDVRRPEAIQASNGLLPAAVLRDAQHAASWTLAPHSGTIVVACRHGHGRSQMAAAHLRARGFDARVLEGGYDAWQAAGLPLVDRAAVRRLAPNPPSLWVTRRRPKIDRIACPWLIRRFIDVQARFLFVDPPQVTEVARESGATPFDIEGVELSHEGERCSFDTLLRVFALESDPSLARLALIVRGADTARPDFAPEAAGLHAVSLGLSVLAGDDDHGLLHRGFAVYDALFAWLRFASSERHNWPARAA